MIQFQKMVTNRRAELAVIAKINAEVMVRGDYALAYRNMASSFEIHFDTALLRWRHGESPVSDMQEALSVSGKMLAAITEWQLDDEILIGYGHTWNVVRFVSFLLDQPAELPEDRLIQIRQNISKAPDVALDFHILDALEGREWRENLPAPFERLASRKRQMLAVETYRTYFDILDTDGDVEAIEPLVRIAEANFKKRSRDGFYSGGPTFMGGGPDNPYVVDFVLSAILKKVGWTGDTIHKWRWAGA